MLTNKITINIWVEDRASQRMPKMLRLSPLARLTICSSPSSLSGHRSPTVIRGRRKMYTRNSRSFIETNIKKAAHGASSQGE
jgi:hypothetical protein